MSESMVRLVLGNIMKPIKETIVNPNKIDEEVRFVADQLRMIRAFLKDVERQETTSYVTQELVQRLKDLTYVMDDVIDEYYIESHQLKGLSNYKPMSIMFRRRFAGKLEEIRRRLELFSNETTMVRYVTVPDEIIELRQSSLIISQDRVLYGRDRDKKQIMEFLLSQARDSDYLSIYPVVGLAGVGKTRLAQVVFNDVRVRSHFNMQIWVRVTQDFDMRRLLYSILHCITSEKCNGLEFDQLVRKLRELLQSKRFFLVLDDMWKTSITFIGALKNVLTCGSKGACILVTSRDKDVATMMGTCPAHHLSRLSDADCWLLFKEHAFEPDTQSLGKQECTIFKEANMTCLLRSTHYIGFGCGRLSFHDEDFQQVESLRTLYQFEFPSENMISEGYFPANRSLRVLSTNNINFSLLKNLSHLRYLKLYGFEIKRFPDSIYSLRKLEFFKLKNFPKLTCLPKHMTRLQNIRHLDIEDCDSLSGLFPNVGKLCRLRTLSVFFATLGACNSLTELQDLKLRGKLQIKGLENVSSIEAAKKANLMGKEDLLELCLSWDNSGITKPNANGVQQILEGLKPNSNLKALRINGYNGLGFPSWMGIMGDNVVLNNLVVLELTNCQNCTQLPPLGKLPALKKIVIYEMHEVKFIDDDEYYNGVAFPSLEELKLRGLPKLERLLKREREEMFPRLSDMIILDCSNLELSSLPSLK
ncbi:hypothetical protein RJT34_11785 [Clitoria ternatea]|uniref:Uncharacterized protein n=1 Tax=Clitoria ternatea TaxID=43366 RepID=A0AAN9PKT1_CLITE